MRLYNELSKVFPKMEEDIHSPTLELFSQWHYEKISYFFLPLRAYIKDNFLQKDGELYKAFYNAGISSYDDMVVFIITMFYVHIKEKNLPAE